MKVVVDQDIKHFEEIVGLIDWLRPIDFIYAKSKDINSDLVKDAEVILIRSTVEVNQNLLNNSATKLIGSATAGFDHIDSKYLDKRNINWFHAPGCNSSSVVHYVLSCISFLVKNKLFDINNTIGIIGCGNVGGKLRLALNNLGIKNKTYDPFLDMDFLTNINDIKTCELISLHTPLTSNSKYPTKNMLDSNFIEILKNKILINTSRGGIVDESSVLRNKDLIYISDVWNNEPVPNKTLVDRSLIATPHIAGHSFNGKLNGTIILIKNLLKYIDREDRIKDSLEIINNHFSLVKRRQQSPSFNDYFLEYDVNWESQRFKTSFEVADKESYESIFNDLRSKHPLRRDFL